LAGWLNREQQKCVEHLQEENRVLKEHGIEPVPERGSKTRWTEFLRAHWDTLTAADFFTTEI
jgi:hypothetical protein